jgi:hypothetical protein
VRENPMQKSSLTGRFLIPLSLALIVMLSSRAVYVHSGRIESQALYHTVALTSGGVQFVSIVFAALFVYPVTYFRGATAAERVVASSTNLALWVGIDSYHVSVAFNYFETLYYGMNIGSIVLAWNFAMIGILESACRCARKKRGDPIRALTPLPFLPILVFLLVIAVLSKEGGAYYWNKLLGGYVALFRN